MQLSQRHNLLSQGDIAARCWLITIGTCAPAAELAAPQVVTRLREAVPPAQLLDRDTGFSFPQEADDPLFGETLLPVQSPDCMIGL